MKIYKEDLRLKVEGTKLMFSNDVLTKNSKRTNMIADASSGDTAISVANYNDLADNMYLLVGEWGEPTAEIVQINDASVDTTVTIGALVNDHYTDTPITVIPYDKVEFARATTLVDPNGAGSVTQLGSDVAIMAYRHETVYNDDINSTGYAYARFQNTEDTSYSEYSVGVSYDGNAYNSVEKMCQEAVDLVGINIGDEHATEKELIRDLNQCQNIITKSQDWVFELENDDTSITSTLNEYIYSLSSLSMKYPNSKQGIMNAKFGSTVIEYKDWHEFERFLEGTAKTTAAATGAVGATTLTLTDSNEFAASGTVYVGTNSVTYTANNKTTGVLSGIATSGSYSIETEITTGDVVWQGANPGVPDRYSIFSGSLYLNVPVESGEAGKKIKLKYLKKLDRFTDFSNTTDIPFYEALPFYLAYKIEIRRKNYPEAKMHKNYFDEILEVNKDAYKMPILETMGYYDFGFGDRKDTDDDYNYYN